MTEVEVANLALTQLGADRINTLTEDSENARSVNAIFGSMRDEVLREHPWNFAIKRVKLALLSAKPEFGFENQFQLPGDVLRVLDLENKSNKFSIEADKLLTDSGEVRIRYVSRIEDVTLWDSAFITTFAARLAAELAYNLTDNLSAAQRWFEKYLLNLRKAKAADAQEGTPDRITASLWLKSRRAGANAPRVTTQGTPL